MLLDFTFCTFAIGLGLKTEKDSCEITRVSGASPRWTSAGRETLWPVSFESSTPRFSNVVNKAYKVMGLESEFPFGPDSSKTTSCCLKEWIYFAKETCQWKHLNLFSKPKQKQTILPSTEKPRHQDHQVGIPQLCSRWFPSTKSLWPVHRFRYSFNTSSPNMKHIYY